jgi:hypothetical protein
MRLLTRIGLCDWLMDAPLKISRNGLHVLLIMLKSFSTHYDCFSRAISMETNDASHDGSGRIIVALKKHEKN